MIFAYPKAEIDENMRPTRSGTARLNNANTLGADQRI